MSSEIKIDLYCDSADLSQMKALYDKGLIDGFTTNPSLLHQAGVRDYAAYAKEVLSALPDAPISFEVLGNDFETMRAEADVIASWGGQVFVKVPILTTSGESCAPLIKELSQKGISLNVTLLFTDEQITEAIDALNPDVPAIVSVFAGRIADTGRDPEPMMRRAKEQLQGKPKLKLLWASTRETLNIFQAQDLGCDIVTVPPSVLGKLSLLGQDLYEMSLEGAKAFEKDAASSGLSLLNRVCG